MRSRLPLALLLLLLAWGCVAAPPDPESTASPAPTARLSTVQVGGTLTVGLSGPALTFDPSDQRDPATQTVLRNLYDGLVASSPSGEVVPELAESITQSSGCATSTPT